MMAQIVTKLSSRFLSFLFPFFSFFLFLFNALNLYVPPFARRLGLQDRIAASRHWPDNPCRTVKKEKKKRRDETLGLIQLGRIRWLRLCIGPRQPLEGGKKKTNHGRPLILFLPLYRIHDSPTA